MATFEPQVPDSRDPNLPNIRPIESLGANNSAAIGINTIASGLDDAVKVVDTAIKKGIQDRAYAGVDPQRDQFTSALEKIKAQANNDGQAAGSVVPPAVQAVTGPTTGKSLLDAHAEATDEEDIPDGLASGLDRINQLAAAKAAGSVKLNDTQYAMETLSVAKTLRATYGTGYRDYIDEQVSKASGLPVANSYYQNLMQDINRQLNQNKQTKDEIGGLMLKNMDAPGIPAELARRRAGQPPQMSDTDVYTQIGDWQHLQSQYRIDAASRANKDATKADDVEDVAKKATGTFSSEVNLSLKGVTASAGVPSAGALAQYLTDVQMQKHPEATQIEINQRVAQLDAYVAKQRASLWAKGTEGGENSILAKVGPERFQKIVDQALTPMTVFSTMAKDKDSGPAFQVAHQNDAILQQDKKGILLNQDTGSAARQYEAVRSILGDGAFPDYMKSVAQNSKDFKDPLSTLFAQESLSAITPPADTFGKPLTPPRTMLDSIQKAKEVAAAGTQVPPEYFGKTIQRVESITNPKMPADVKDKLINYSFNPKNRNLLDELNRDYKDPKTGQWVPGQYAAFNILSAPKITNAVKETAVAHPENYNMYQDTVQEQFGKLFRSDLVTLNKAVANPEMEVHFSFNAENNNFGLVDKNNRPITRENLDQAQIYTSKKTDTYNKSDFYKTSTVRMLDILEKVNKEGINNLAYVYKSNPNQTMDLPQYLLRTMQTAGFRPGENITNATEGMTKAIIKAQAPESTQQDLANSVLKFAPEDSNDLASFLRSPAGNYHGQANFVSNPTNEPLPKAPRGQVVGPNETITGIKNDEIPAGMGVKEFIQMLKREGRY